MLCRLYSEGGRTSNPVYSKWNKMSLLLQRKILFNILYDIRCYLFQSLLLKFFSSEVGDNKLPCVWNWRRLLNVSIWFVSWISQNKVENITVLEINTACVCLVHILLKCVLCTDVLDVVYDGRVYIKWKQFITAWHKLMLVFIYYCVRYDVDCLNILTL